MNIGSPTPTSPAPTAERRTLRQRLRQRPLALSLTYIGIIVYASLYANKAWRDNGMGLFDFLGAGWPHYWTWQDATFNVLAYLPLGFLLALAPAHRRSPWARILLPVLLGFCLSATLEAVQTFIPGRVSSSLDLLCNTLGTLCGAALSLFCGPILLTLWLFAQISPETLFFGLGDVRTLLTLPSALPFSADLHLTLETCIATLQTLVVGFLLCVILNRLALSSAQQWLIIVLLLALGAGIRTLSSWLLLSPLPLFADAARWAALTPGGLKGLGLGLVLLWPLRYLPVAWQTPLAATCLMTATVLVNLMPINPYSLTALTVWRQGHFLNFNGLTRLIAALWPYLTLLFLVWTDRQAARDKVPDSRL